MKKLFFILFASSCVTSGLYAQNCKSVDEKKDPFTGKMVKSARIAVGNLMTKWLVYMNQSDGSTIMKWNIAMQGEFNTKLPEGTIMLVKLEDGTVMNLKTFEPTTPVTQALAGGAGTVNVFTTYLLNFNLSKDELTMLSKSPITDIKIDVPGLNIKNAKLKGGQMDKIMNVSGCMLATAG